MKSLLVLCSYLAAFRGGTGDGDSLNGGGGMWSTWSAVLHEEPGVSGRMEEEQGMRFCRNVHNLEQGGEPKREQALDKQSL